MPELEAELKFRAGSEAPLRALANAGRLGPADLGPGRTFDELDRYLDTADGRLAAARWACRLRTRPGQTLISLKGPSQHRSGSHLHLRPEVEGPAGDGLAPAGWPPSEARDRLLELTGGAPLRERLALRQRRTERRVTIAGAEVGTLSLDRCTVTAGGIARGTMGVVELELRDPGAGAPPPGLEAALRAVPGLEPETASKLERALAMLEGEPSPPAAGAG